MAAKSELNAYCRSIGASYIGASTFGMFGAVFVDEGSPRATFEAAESFSLYPTLARNISKVHSHTYSLDRKDYPLTTDKVSLSTRVSGNLKPNLHYSLPYETAQKEHFERLIAESEAKESEKEQLRRIVFDYFDADYSTPCPLEGLEFPIVGERDTCNLTIRDPYNVLESLLPQIKSITPVTPSLTISPMPLSSHLWTSIDFVEPDEPSKILNLHARITCFAPEMMSDLTTYIAFLRLHLTDSTQVNAVLPPTESESAYPIPPGSKHRPSLWNRLFSTCNKLFVPTEAFVSSVVATEAAKIATKIGIPLNQWMFFDAPELAELLLPEPLYHPSPTSSPGCSLQTSAATSNSSSAPPLNDDLLLLPPSRYPLLSHASIVFTSFQATSELISQNLALSGVCSNGSVAIFPPAKISKSSGVLQLDQSLLWKSSSALGYNDQTSVHLRLSPSAAKYEDLDAVKNLKTGNIVISGDQPLELLDWTAVRAVPCLHVWNGGDAVVAVESFVPHHGAHLRNATIHSTSSMAPSHSNFPNGFADCRSWAFTTAQSYLGSSEQANMCFASPNFAIALPAGISWINRPRQTLIDCVAWAKDWIISSTVYWPKRCLQSIPLLRTDQAGALCPHTFLSPRSLSDSMIEDGDPLARNLVVTLAIISAMQSKVLPFDDFAQSLARYYSSMHNELLDMALGLPIMTYSQYMLDEARNAGGNQAAHIVQVQNFVLAPGFEDRRPRNMPPFSDLKDTHVLDDLIFALSTLRSRCFGLGEIPSSLLSATTHTAPLPTAYVAAAALTAIETMKLLLLSNMQPSPSSSAHFREYYLNMLAMELKPAPLSPLARGTLPNGVEWTEWDFLHLFVPRSVTPSDLVDTLKRRYGLNLNSLCEFLSLLWSDLFPAHQHRLHLPVLQIMAFIKAFDASNRDHLVLIAGAEDDAGEDVPIPKLYLHFTDDSPFPS